MSDWCKTVEDIIGNPIKREQRSVLQELLNNQHVFAVFPTGYGKSVCFGAFPAAYEKVHPNEEAIALVIAPLNALTASHVQSWMEKGVKSTVLKPMREIDEETLKGVQRGDYKLLFASPEAALDEPWWSVIRSIRDKVKLLAVDEAHCLYQWGTTFREAYLKVIQIRSIVTDAVTLALTATASTTLVSEVMTKLGLTDRMKIMTLCPDRPEIFLKMEKVGPDFDDSFSWYADLLESQQEQAPKAIIYSRTTEAVIRIYFYLNGKLDKKAEKDGDTNNVNSRFIEMYHGKSDKESQQRIVSNFRKPGSVLRCVVSTVAFGLGVDIPNVRYVLHWGPAKDPLAYWQEVGRCARDGDIGEAITYIPPRSKDRRVIHKDMLAVVDSTLGQEECVRKKVLSYMQVGSTDNPMESRALCCCVCQVSM